VDGLVIREIELERDYDALAALWAGSGPGLKVGRSDSRAELAKKLKRDPDLFLIAEAEGHLIGSVIGGWDGRRGLVYHLAVAESHRRNGIGARLMREVEARLQAKGCLRAYLAVMPENLEVLTFYEQLGWTPMKVQFLAKYLDSPPAAG
jgi:ribosomal protein S18 acetylase RimI-like enzyme